MFGALIVLIAVLIPATSLARGNAVASPDLSTPVAAATLTATADQSSFASATPTPTVIGVAGISLRGAPALPAFAAAAVCPVGTPQQGIDVSYYQGSFQGSSINWTQVAKSGKTFAYARAADGVTFQDPDFQVNYAGIKAAGMKAGAYLFFRPDEDPTAQAITLTLALKQAGFATGDLVPMLDVEVSDGESGATIAANLQTAITYLQQSLGVTAVIYTAPNTWNSIVGSTSFGMDPLWIANWFVSCPSLPNGWTTWVLWQYNDNSTVSGISGYVDGDETNGPSLPLNLPIRQYVPSVPNAAPSP